MISYLGCDAAREMLQAFVDRELPMAEQVELESHLRWCETCAARVEDLRLIGAGVRLGAAVPGLHAEDPRALAVIQSEVLTRIRAERDQSLSVWCREPVRRHALSLAGDRRHRRGRGVPLCRDECQPRRPGRAPVFDGRPDLDAGEPWSDRNPLQLDSRMLAPRPLITARRSIDSGGGSGVRAGGGGDPRRPGRELRAAAGRDESAHVTRAARRREGVAVHARQTPDGAVAVNVVWLLARTTVKASIDPNDSGRSGAADGARSGDVAAEPAQRGAAAAGASPRALVILFSASVARMMTPRAAASPSSRSSNCSRARIGDAVPRVDRLPAVAIERILGLLHG